MNFDTSDINNLLNDPASVSFPIKMVAIFIVFMATIAAGYKFVITEQLVLLEQVESREEVARAAYEVKQGRANKLPAYKKQLEEMRLSFAALKNQLPSDTEIPGLILDISEKGLSNGLEIGLFKPEREISKEFFSERPIKIEAKGTYAELAGFVSDLSSLPRIVTINNIHLKHVKVDRAKAALVKSEDDNAGSRLSLKATIKTYRYLSEGAESKGTTPESIYEEYKG